jgi:hypothetical protein
VLRLQQEEKTRELRAEAEAAQADKAEALRALEQAQANSVRELETLQREKGKQHAAALRASQTALAQEHAALLVQRLAERDEAHEQALAKAVAQREGQLRGELQGAGAAAAERAAATAAEEAAALAGEHAGALRTLQASRPLLATRSSQRTPTAALQADAAHAYPTPLFLRREGLTI